MVSYGNKSIHFPSKNMKFKQKMSFKILTNVCGEDGVSSNIKMQILAEYFSPEALVFIVTMNSSKEDILGAEAAAAGDSLDVSMSEVNNNTNYNLNKHQDRRYNLNQFM